jgi:hypothetical protein
VERRVAGDISGAGSQHRVRHPDFAGGSQSPRPRDVGEQQWGFHLKKPGPYDFQKKGAAAFRRFAENVRLPNPFECLKPPTKIKV